jgi:polysulfide reductase-like protein
MADEIRSYHGQPVLKEPIWSWEIPCYFFTGGMAGASAGLAGLAELRGNEKLSRHAWLVALAGIATSPALLTSDLGKPTRFLNMLRMFKVTSPMSVGSWLLSASGATTGLAAANCLTGAFPRAGRLAKPAAGVFGLPLSTYTAALIANTAVPVWHEARRELPFLFGAGAAMSAGAAVTAATPIEAAAPARRLALGGAVAEIALSKVMEKRLGELGEPYQQGVPHRLSLLSKLAVAAGGALVALRGAQSRVASVAGGLLMCAGGLGMRWSVFKAGFASAADPKYVVGPQRAAIERGERRGGARGEARVSAGKPGAGSPATAAPTPLRQQAPAGD